MKTKILYVLLFVLLLITRLPAQNFWQPTGGPSSRDVHALAVNNNGVVFAGTRGGVFRSANNGATWVEVNSGLTNSHVQVLAIDSNNNLYAGTQGGVFRSTNNGNNWTLTGLTSDVRALDIKANGDIFAITFGLVHLSTNKGNNWTEIKSQDPCSFRGLSSIAINSKGDLFVGGGEFNGSYIFRSTNNGVSWDCRFFGGKNDFVHSLAINSNGVVFGGETTTVFRSTDNGANWSSLSLGFGRNPVRALTINASGHIFAGTQFGGVFRSTNNGDSWTTINTGLTKNDVRALAVKADGHIFAGTMGGGVFVHGSFFAPKLCVEPNRWLAPPGNSSKNISVINCGNDGSSIEYSVSKNANWLTVAPAFGKTSSIFDIMASRNITGSTRTANVTVNANLSGIVGSPQIIRVTQAPFAHLILRNEVIDTRIAFAATDSITAGPSFIIKKSGDVTFRAGKKIKLRPGFKAEKGNRFHSFIDPVLRPVIAPKTVFLKKDESKQ